MPATIRCCPTQKKSRGIWLIAHEFTGTPLVLHQFLANPGDLRRFLPGSSGDPVEAQLLRGLVDLFPVCGGVAIVTTLAGGLQNRWRLPLNAVLGLTGGVPLIAWAVGIGRLPPGAAAEVGLWLIALSSTAVLVGLLFELQISRR